MTTIEASTRRGKAGPRTANPPLPNSKNDAPIPPPAAATVGGAPPWRRRYADLPIDARLGDIRRLLIDLITGGSVEDQLTLDHLTWAVAHINEAGRQAESGEGRSVRWMQNDIYEAAMRQGRLLDALAPPMGKEGAA